MNDKSIIQKNFIHYIDEIVSNDRISHAYLIEVNNYDEDLSYLYSFIKMILCNCSYEELDQLNNPIITQIDSGNYPDLMIISSDTSVINKSLILDLKDEFSNKSLLDGKRIYIINGAEKLNGYSANTILKFLEEPEDDIIAFLVTDNRYHVLDTILSRCQVLSLKDDTFTFSINDSIIDLLELIINPNYYFIQYNSLIKDTFVDKNVLKEQLMVVENVLLSYLENSNSSDENIVSMLKSFDNKQIVKILSILEEEIPKLSFNVNFKLWLDSLFSKLIGG